MLKKMLEGLLGSNKAYLLTLRICR